MNKKINSVSSAETNDEVSANVEVSTSNPNNAKPRVGGSLLFTNYDLERLYDWINDDNRRPAITAFTSGVARNIASAIEFKFLKQ